MAYAIKQLDGEPIFIVTYEPPADWTTEPAEVGRAIVEMSEVIDGLHVSIHDMRAMEALTMKDAIDALRASFNRENAFIHSYGWIIGVGHQRWLKLTIDTARQMKLSPVPVELCLTMEEALERAREILAEQKSAS